MLPCKLQQSKELTKYSAGFITLLAYGSEGKGHLQTAP